MSVKYKQNGDIIDINGVLVRNESKENISIGIILMKYRYARLNWQM